MPAEAAFRVTVKDAKGNLCTVGGDSYDEFADNLGALLGHEGAGRFLDGYRAAFGGGASEAPSFAQAEATVVQAFPQAAPVAQPVQQPQAAPAPTGPTCAHGPRVYKDTVSAKGPWRRWECAIPWQRNADNSQRCPNVNA
jgi:hypothetical protein